jgi:hypothetical protein
MRGLYSHVSEQMRQELKEKLQVDPRFGEVEVARQGLIRPIAREVEWLCGQIDDDQAASRLPVVGCMLPGLSHSAGHVSDVPVLASYTLISQTSASSPSKPESTSAMPDAE